MFELFTGYSDSDPDQVHDNLIVYENENRKEIKQSVKNYLPEGVSLGNWILLMTHKRHPGDELTLFLLCKLFNRHAVIIIKNGLWTTLATTNKED